MRGARTPSWLLAALALAATSCSTSFGYAPVARIVVSPKFVPQGDGFTTDVMLDGRTSADPLGNPDAGYHDLAFAWSFTGDEVRVTKGSLTAPNLVVRVAGARPVQLVLTVQNPGGQSASAAAAIGLTVPAADGGAPDQ